MSADRTARMRRAIMAGVSAAREAEAEARALWERYPCRRTEDAWIDAQCNLADTEAIADEWARADEVAYPTLSLVAS